MRERDYSSQDNTIAKIRSNTQWVIVFAKFNHFDFMNIDKYVGTFIYLQPDGSDYHGLSFGSNQGYENRYDLIHNLSGNRNSCEIHIQ